MYLHRTTLHLLALTIIFTGFAGYTFINAAWTVPLAPPTNNVDAPINVGSIDQVKSAGLSVDALSVIGGSMGITSPGPRIKMTNTSTVPPSFDWWLYANGSSFYLIADRDGNGNWNTPSEAPWPMQVVVGTTSTSDFVKFSNKVRAKQYCDENGLNCFKASDVVPQPRTCQVRFDARIETQSRVLISQNSVTLPVPESSSPRLGGWVACDGDVNDYYTASVLRRRSGGSTFDSGETTELGYWSELDYLNNEGAINGIRYKSIQQFEAEVGVTRNLQIWNGCTDNYGTISATVLSCE